MTSSVRPHRSTWSSLVSPELVLLDVAHGNCALVLSDEAFPLVDAPRGGLHIDALKMRDRLEVDVVVISHADVDHMGGLSHLLYDEDVRVRAVYVNADASKTAGGGGLVWGNFARAMADAMGRGETTVTAVKRGDPIACLEEPSGWRCLHRARGCICSAPVARWRANPLTSNALSVVIRVWFGDDPVAPLTGDLDDLGLRKLLEVVGDLHAQVMVVPHHGGHSGGDDDQFARTIGAAVNPKHVVFSFGREQYDNPQVGIIRGIREAAPGARIACTQLSKACSPEPLDPAHLAQLPAKGRGLGRCCAGSMLFAAEGLREPVAGDHTQFVEQRVPTPLCIRSFE